MTFIYSETARVTLKTIAHFLRSHQIDAEPIFVKILDEFESRTRVFPDGCPICNELLMLGCSKYRECNTVDGYRVLYSAALKQDTVVIYVHAILSQRQNISNLLFNRILEW
ncbi:TPA: type II toxin-antitoxin system RelE/ParE family toxin [Yersinia enterocolitica]|nr:type II toxin-antitoxin system RelE/ParE family toxin [Yersinia enterocolitica]